MTVFPIIMSPRWGSIPYSLFPIPYSLFTNLCGSLCNSVVLCVTKENFTENHRGGTENHRGISNLVRICFLTVFL